jgi:hypothetical protein
MPLAQKISGKKTIGEILAEYYFTKSSVEPTI